jgi:hypothetical protein
LRFDRWRLQRSETAAALRSTKWAAAERRRRWRAEPQRLLRAKRIGCMASLLRHSEATLRRCPERRRRRRAKRLRLLRAKRIGRLALVRHPETAAAGRASWLYAQDTLSRPVRLRPLALRVSGPRVELATLRALLPTSTRRRPETLRLLRAKRIGRLLRAKAARRLLLLHARLAHSRRAARSLVLRELVLRLALVALGAHHAATATLRGAKRTPAAATTKASSSLLLPTLRAALLLPFIASAAAAWHGTAIWIVYFSRTS